MDTLSVNDVFAAACQARATSASFQKQCDVYKKGDKYFGSPNSVIHAPESCTNTGMIEPNKVHAICTKNNTFAPI